MLPFQIATNSSWPGKEASTRAVRDNPEVLRLYLGALSFVVTMYSSRILHAVRCAWAYAAVG